MEASGRTLSPHEEHNKAVILAYYRSLCEQWDFAAASRYIGPHFRQHNPLMADGAEGVRAWVENRPPFADRLRPSIKRVIVDGDFVVLHVLVSAPGVPDVPDMAIVDTFRLEDGKVVEHWDVMQPVPAEAAHANGMF